MKNVKIYWKDILIYGLILGGLFSVVILVSFAVEPLIWVHDTPPEVQKQVGEIPPDVAAKGMVVFLIILVLMLIFPILLNRVIIRTDYTKGSFVNLVVNGFLLLNFMNLFDLLIVDILIFNIIQPNFMMIKGAEEYMREYVTATFHLIAFFKGQPYMIVMALLSAAISLIYKKQFLKWKENNTAV